MAIALSNDETAFEDEKENSETEVDYKLQGPKSKKVLFLNTVSKSDLPYFDQSSNILKLSID